MSTRYGPSRVNICGARPGRPRSGVSWSPREESRTAASLFSVAVFVYFFFYAGLVSLLMCFCLTRSGLKVESFYFDFKWY